MADIWVVIPLKDSFIEALRARYRVHYAPDGPSDAAFAALAGAPVRGVVTNGSTGLARERMAQLPKLEVVSCFGAGYENVDRAAAAARGIAVTHAPGVNDSTVADHALALLLALARGLVAADRAVHQGQWKTSRVDRPTLFRKRLGVIGLGNIGLGIARRAAAFEMDIGYHTRRPRPDVDWQHYPSLTELARASDFLVAACPGGPATRHLVDAPVLAALGPHGFLVNIARGSVVDTRALIEALAQRRIAGAALDVIEGEPEVPPALLALDTVIFTPHVAGRSPEVLRAQLDSLFANLDARFAGQPVPAPVPAVAA